MKAAVLFEAGKPLEIADVAVSKPGPREVLIRTVACGVCRSDLHFVDGAFPHPVPTVPGHEAAGVIEAILVGFHWLLTTLGMDPAAGLTWVLSIV